MEVLKLAGEMNISRKFHASCGRLLRFMAKPRAVLADVVRKSFEKCTVSNHLNGTEDDCVFRSGNETSDGSSDNDEPGDG